MNKRKRLVLLKLESWRSHNSVAWGGCVTSMVWGLWAGKRDCVRLVPNSIQGAGIRQLMSPSLEGLMRLFLEVLEQLQTEISYCYWSTLWLSVRVKKLCWVLLRVAESKQERMMPHSLFFSCRFPQALMISSLREGQLAKEKFGLQSPIPMPGEIKYRRWVGRLRHNEM